MFSLSLANVAWTLLLLATCKALHQFVRYRYFHPLSAFPGPVLATTTRLWLAFQVVKGADHAYHAFKRLHDQYGPVIRVSPTTILVSDATAVPVIYGRNVAKTPAYGAGIPLEVRQSMMNMHDPKTHNYHRKLLAAPFSTGNIRKMEPVIDTRVEHWLRTMEDRFEKKDAEFDLAPWVTFLTHDVISNLAFGQPLGFVENGADVEGLVGDIRGSLVFIGVMSRMYPVFNWLRDIGIMGAICPDMERTPLGTLARFRDKLTDERMAAKAAGQEDEKNDLFQALLEARDEKGDPVDEQYIKAEILNLILAGAETTGSSLQSFMFRMLSDKKVYSKVMAEVEAAEAAGHFASGVVSFDALNAHCPYYVACWKESLRLVPPVPSEFPRVVPEGGITLHGHFIPAGTDIAISTWLGQRDPNVYGEDANDFRPERWFNPDDAAEFSRLGLAWGSGARKCLGQDIAKMEIHKAALEFLRRFRPSLVERKGREAKLVFTGDMSHYEDMWVKLERRGQEGVGKGQST